jgi:hypothetical protein
MLRYGPFNGPGAILAHNLMNSKLAIMFMILVLSGCGDAGKSPERIRAEAAIVQAQAEKANAEADLRREEVERVKVDTETARKAQPAAVASQALVYLSLGLGVLILCAGGTLTAIAWLAKQATSVYPNSAGQYPVIVRRSWNGVIVHDPNRAIGPTTIYTAQDLLPMLAARAGLVSPDARCAGQGHSEGAQLQIASQAQAVALAAAATRRGNDEAQQAIQLARHVAGDGAPLALPPVRVIRDTAAVEAMLMEAE